MSNTILELQECPLRGIRWISSFQIHLTLRFLGECTLEILQTLKEQCIKIHSPSFILKTKGLGCFPHQKNPRVLWLGIENSAELFDLQRNIETVCLQIGCKAEMKAFHPHLTFGRFKENPQSDLKKFFDRFNDFPSISWRVDRWILYSSRLTPQGAQHTKEAEFFLGSS